MAGGITFTGHNQAGSFERLSAALMARAMDRIVSAADQTIKDAQDAIMDNIDHDFGDRVGKPRSEPLADVSHYPGEVEVRETGVTMRFRVQGSPPFLSKWGALNYGSGSHDISPTTQNRTGRLMIGNEDAGFAAGATVTHPGTKGTRFWTRAVDQALGFFRSRL